MGIRKKIFLGFVIIGFILFLSGFICIFQLVKIEKSVSGILTDNIISINITKHLLDETESQAWDVFQAMINNKTGAGGPRFNEVKFKILIDSAARNITAHGEERIIKDLRRNYEAFKHSSVIMDSLLTLPYYTSARVESFNNEYRPSLVAFITSVRTLREINQEAISQNSLKLENNFYRMIMPLIIAISVGLFLIIIFNYFINLYFITPVLAITKGIKNYFDHKATYDVKVDTADEINDLNQEVKVLISHSKKKDAPPTSGVFEFKKK